MQFLSKSNHVRLGKFHKGRQVTDLVRGQVQHCQAVEPRKRLQVTDLV
jgi:hypothetical protein